MKILVTGGAGFIGSHVVDRLISEGHKVTVLDNLLSGSKNNLNRYARFYNTDIRSAGIIRSLFEGQDAVMHYAAIARTPWCIDDPILCYQTNVLGTLNILENSRKAGVKRVVLSSSNVVYAFDTPYKSSKLAGEALAEVYVKMYGQSVISLRYSNVYGKRQSELGPSPNVFAALRKCKKEKGFLEITGDGEQSRNYTHVSDIVAGNLLALKSDYCGVVDLCTGVPVTLNEVAKYFNCPVNYVPDRPGDVKHILQDPAPAERILGFKAKVSIADGIKDVL